MLFFELELDAMGPQFARRPAVGAIQDALRGVADRLPARMLVPDILLVRTSGVVARGTVIDPDGDWDIWVRGEGNLADETTEDQEPWEEGGEAELPVERTKRPQLDESVLITVELEDTPILRRQGVALTVGEALRLVADRLPRRLYDGPETELRELHHYIAHGTLVEPRGAWDVRVCPLRLAEPAPVRSDPFAGKIFSETTLEVLTSADLRDDETAESLEEAVRQRLERWTKEELNGLLREEYGHLFMGVRVSGG